MSMNGSIGLGFALGAVDNTGPAFKSASKRLNGLFDEAKGKAAGAKGAFTKGGASAGKGFVGGLKKTMGNGTDGGVAGAISKSFSGLFGKLAGFIGGGAIIGAFGTVIGAANNFTESLSKLRAITGATTPQMDALRKSALEAGIATQFPPTEAADALRDLASKGYNVKQSMALLIPTLDLAAASLGELGPQDAAGLASQAMKTFGLSVNQAGGVVDKLVRSMPLLGIQAKDLKLGLANAGRGAGILNQSLDETLISFGLVHQIMPRVASAGTAVSTAMEKLVSKKTQSALKKLGVDVLDSAGKFRPFLDIVNEMRPGLDKMTDAQKASFLSTTFGTRAMGGLQAIMKQISNGIPDANGKMLKGGDAVAYLRGQLDKSGGAAAKFREELLKDLPGQLKLLHGTIETLFVSLGGPVADALAPIVSVVTDALNEVIKSFESLSKGAKKHIAEIALAVGGLAAVFLFAGGPVTLVLLGIAAAIFGIYEAVKYSDPTSSMNPWIKIIDKVKLAWSALSQLFSQGGFSGTVRDELNKAENKGLKSFLIGVFVWGHRIKHFIEELAEGFSAGMARAQPAFEAFGRALDKLGAALGFTSANDPKKNLSSWEKWGNIGAQAGEKIAGAIEWLAGVLAGVMEMATSVIDTFRDWGGVSGDVGNATSDLSDALVNLAVAMGISDPSDSTSAWQTFGSIIGGSVSFSLGLIADAIGGIAGMLDAASMSLRGFKDIFIGFATGDWGQLWKGMKEVAYGVIKGIIKSVGLLVEQLARAVDAMGKIAGKDFGAHDKVQSLLKDINSSFDDEKKRELPETKKRKGSALGDGASSALLGLLHPDDIAKIFPSKDPRDNAGRAPPGGNFPSLPALGGFAGLALQVNKIANSGAGRGGHGPIQVKSTHTTIVQLDKSVIARIVKEQIQEDKARSGHDQPAGDD